VGSRRERGATPALGSSQASVVGVHRDKTESSKAVTPESNQGHVWRCGRVEESNWSFSVALLMIFFPSQNYFHVGGEKGIGIPALRGGDQPESATPEGEASPVETLND